MALVVPSTVEVARQHERVAAVERHREAGVVAHEAARQRAGLVDLDAAVAGERDRRQRQREGHQECETHRSSRAPAHGHVVSVPQKLPPRS